MDDYSLMGEPATETVPIDSAKAAMRFGSGVVKDTVSIISTQSHSGEHLFNLYDQIVICNPEVYC